MACSSVSSIGRKQINSAETITDGDRVASKKRPWRRKEVESNVGIRSKSLQGIYVLWLVARQANKPTAQVLAPEVIAKRTRHHLDELEVCAIDRS